MSQNPSKFSAFYQGKGKLYLYIFGVFVFSIFTFYISTQEYVLTFIQPLLNIYTSISSAILNLFGYTTTANQEILSGEGISLEVKKGCDAVAPMILYFLSILFFPTSFKSKPKAILFGITLLFLLNIVRIVSLYVIMDFYPSIFDFMHTQVWQILFIIFTLYLWLRWLTKQNIAPDAVS